MTQTFPILFVLVFVAAAFLCFPAHSLPFLSNLPMEIPTISAYSGKSGDIDIKRDPYGFYVEADFGYNTIYGPQPEPEPNPMPYGSGKMMISLSNSETTATSTCLNFSDYNYTGYNWAYNMWETTISYPNFLAPSLAGYSFIYLDRKYWGITRTKVFLTKLNACQTGANASLIGSDRDGVLGLGSDKTQDNFWVSKNFSVYIKPDLSAGKLLFMNNTSNYTASLEPVHKLTADVNWRLLSPSGSIGIKNYSAAFENRNVIFDIHSDAIGLPSDLFTLFLSYFVQIPGISCSSDLYKPDCNTTGSAQDLPDITLSVNSTQIKIPSIVYAAPNDTNSSFFKLNLKATSPDLSGFSYVTPAFKDSIILDAHFMSNYFTVFGFATGSNVITLYPAATDNKGDNPDDPTRWMIIIGAAVVIFLVIIGCCVKRKIAATKLTANIVKEEPYAYNYTSYNQRINPS